MKMVVGRLHERRCFADLTSNVRVSSPQLMLQFRRVERPPGGGDVIADFLDGNVRIDTEAARAEESKVTTVVSMARSPVELAQVSNPSIVKIDTGARDYGAVERF